MAQLYCGTSGFAYASWKPEFYPAKLAAKNFLQHYATRLNAVEINYTFRRLPSTSTLESWVQATPDGFVFLGESAPAHHAYPAAEGASEFTEVFFRAIDPLRAVAKRLGTVLFQTPPNLKCDPAAARERFLKALPEGYRCAFEFRNTSWLADRRLQAAGEVRRGAVPGGV